MDGAVWDGAPSHRGKLMGQVGIARIFLPAYSPELPLHLTLTLSTLYALGLRTF